MCRHVEGMKHIGVEGPQVSVVDPYHIRIQTGKIQFTFGMQFHQHFQTQLMRHGYQMACIIHFKVCCYQKNSVSPRMSGFKYLVFVYDEILAQDGFRYQGPCTLDIFQIASEVVAVGQDTQCSCSISGI